MNSVPLLYQKSRFMNRSKELCIYVLNPPVYDL